MSGLLDDLTLDSDSVSLDAMVNNISNGVASNYARIYVGNGCFQERRI